MCRHGRRCEAAGKRLSRAGRVLGGRRRHRAVVGVRDGGEMRLPCRAARSRCAAGHVRDLVRISSVVVRVLRRREGRVGVVEGGVALARQ